MSIKVAQLAEEAGLRIVRGATDRLLSEMTEDSRRVEPSDLFVARRGIKVDGREFVAQAIERGATAVLSDDDSLDTGHATLLVPHPGPTPFHRIIATTAECFYGWPSSHLTLIGVTGTNGKTTTAHLLQQVLEHAGWQSGLIGTIITDDGVARSASSLTTPSAIDLSRALAHMIRNGCAQAVMEVSSHALDQDRAAALQFDIGIFTNLTGDHLDYHGSMEAYALAKSKLFRSLPPGGLAIINAQDSAAENMVANCRATVRRSRVSDTPIEPGAGEVVAHIEELHPRSTKARFGGPFGNFDLDLPLIGRHNVSNALQAATAAAWCGVSAETICESLSRCLPPPGRLEPIHHPRSPFTLYVDYAHTDDALENVLNATRPIVPQGGRLTVVFGCGGDRDRTKRPRMAAVACRLADRIFVTSDNPRTEDPQAIVNELLAGVPVDAQAKVAAEVDRKTAIVRCIGEAGADDLIIIAGKGHEAYQIIGTTKSAFNDRLVASATLQARFGPIGRPHENPA